MGKHSKSSQFPTGKKPQPPSQSVTSQPTTPQPLASKSLRTEDSTESPLESTCSVRPERMSLDAYQHIQDCLNGREKLDKDEVTAILRLSQHLRVFGLLSAVGYLNQAKDSGEVAKRTTPVWEALLGRLINSNNPLRKQELMQKVEQMARNESALYMATWRKALTLSHHWNFWARAYQKEDKVDVHSTPVG